MRDIVFTTFYSHTQNLQHISPKLLQLTISSMILNGIYNSFFFYMWNLIYFQSITYFLYFFSLCALFLKSPRFFCALRL
ncbi:hypothetical protein Hanom_Chr16g01489721 [Helianthus anomalus]